MAVVGNLNSIHDIVATKALYSMKACYAITYKVVPTC